MDHAYEHRHKPESLNRTAFGATWHCLTGCAIGEILGLVIATALDWGNVASIAIAIAIAIVLAFLFGYSLTLRPLVRSGVPVRTDGSSDRPRRRHRLDRRDGDRR
jgi:hypothetical protein